MSSRIEDYDSGPATDEAEKIYEALTRELRYDALNQCQLRGSIARRVGLLRGARHQRHTI